MMATGELKFFVELYFSITKLIQLQDSECRVSMSVYSSEGANLVLGANLVQSADLVQGADLHYLNMQKNTSRGANSNV